MSSLTAGVIAAIANGTEFPAEKPIVQIRGLKKLPGPQSDKYRLSISDGKYYMSSAMLATQLSEKVSNGELDTNTVIKILRYIINQVADRKIIVILELTVVQSGADAGGIIGSPVMFQYSAGSNKPNPETPVKKESDPTTPSGKGIPQSVTNQSPGRNIHPIASLNPYQNRWTIRARITNKSNIRTWSNSRGEGKLFSLDLIDGSGEIRATGFNEQCDQFYDMIEVNKIYYISKATLKIANKAFTSIKNDYEMTFNSGTEIEFCNDSPDNLPVLQFEFVPISTLESLPKDSIIDIIGVCRSSGDVQTITTRNTGKEIQKRDLQLVDKSNTEISLTLWGETAVKHDGAGNPVIAIKGARLSEFNGRSVSALMSSVVYVNPDIKDAHTLRGWYDKEGVNMTATSISSKSFGGTTNWKTFVETIDQGLGSSEKPDYYTVKATVSMLKHETAMYKACPGAECNKKVVEMSNGIYRCEKCNQEFSSFKWRMLLQALLADFTGTRWVTFFQEGAEELIKIPAEELGDLKERCEKSGSTEYIDRINEHGGFKEFIFKHRAKVETYNEEQRLKTICVSVSPINHSDYGKRLITEIKKLTA